MKNYPLDLALNLRVSPEGCFLWQGVRNPFGYGKVGYLGKYHLTHRLFYELFKGPIPNGMCVLHRCDVPACCNPFHLFIGDWKDNNADRARKVRSANMKGERSHRSKLTEEQVRSIRNLRSKGLTYKTIGDLYGVHLSTIHYICNGKHWNHI